LALIGQAACQPRQDRSTTSRTYSLGPWETLPRGPKVYVRADCEDAHA